MLSFDLRRSDVSRSDVPPPCRTTSTGWTVGGGRVEPFRHPMLEDYALVTDDRMLIVVRERCHGAPALPSDLRATAPGEAAAEVSRGRFEAELEAARRWPLQTVLLQVVTGTEEPGVTVASGGWGSAPVYFTAEEDLLRGRWDPVELYPHLGRLGRPRIDPVLAAHFIASFEVPYSRRNVFSGMHTLTERSRARWQPRAGGDAFELRVDYPPPALVPQPGRLKDDVDVLGTFWEILTASMKRWLPPNFETAGAELSGGLDSALVCAAAAEILDAPLETFGLILLGEMGEAQRARRQEMVELFGYRDHTVEMASFLPLGPDSPRWNDGGTVVYWEDCYSEAMGAVLDAAVARDRRLLLTGLGGDELCGLTRAERGADAVPEPAAKEVEPIHQLLPGFLTRDAKDMVIDTLGTLDRAPTSRVSSSSLEAAACCSAMAMRRGLWHVHPLCTPELVRFSLHLPAEWRMERALSRKMVGRLGCSSNVSHPPRDDDFSPACRRSVRTEGRPRISELFGSSRLADLGLVDKDRLLADYRAWCAEGTENGDLPFYSVAVLELNLRALERAAS